MGILTCADEDVRAKPPRGTTVVAVFGHRRPATGARSHWLRLSMQLRQNGTEASPNETANLVLVDNHIDVRVGHYGMVFALIDTLVVAE